MPGGVSDFLWLDDQTLLIGTSGPAARWVTVSLDVSGLAETAFENVSRGFTELECKTYDIDPCPTTLEALRGG